METNTEQDAGRGIGGMRLAVLVATGTVFAAWLALHVPRLLSSQNGIIRFTMTMVFSALILLRPKSERDRAATNRPGGTVLVSTTAFGALLVLAGLIYNVGQFEWIGLLSIAWCCMRWSLPPRYGRDTLIAVLLLYWAHPLPGRIFEPMQTAMQRMSVEGSEWLLHMFNVRVWADGLVLRTVQHVYEVPAWCSGMRTATTVFLLAIGLGVLKRMRKLAVAGLVLAALAQALALNVLRISLMVTFSYNTDGGAGIGFLHNTAGIVVMGCVVLVYFEIELLRTLKQRRVETARNPPTKPIMAASELPPFWYDVGERKLFPILLAAILGVALTSVVVYRSRPYHRTEMVRDVAQALEKRRDLDNAERAARQVRNQSSFDEEWELLIVRILLLRRKYEEVLDALDRLPNSGDVRMAERNILKAYALMALDRMQEAAAIVQTLPRRSIRNDPRVAVILAEMGLFVGDPDQVAAHVPRAAQWPPNLPRIRSLYPYLRQFRKWRAIVESDSDAPYTDPNQAFSAAEAYMNLNIAPVAARMAVQAMSSWPNDPRVLEPLFFMAIKRTDGVWEERFAAHLRHCVNSMQDADRLYGMLEKCFQLSRPDLVWTTIERLRQIDPSHPGIPLSVALYGTQWFRFRRRFLGLPAGRPFETADLKPFFLIGGCLTNWRHLCARVPFGDELAHTDTAEIRKSLLAEATTRFKERLGAGELSLPMRYEYVSALEMAGDVDALQGELEKIVTEHPEQSHKARMVLSGVYERRGDWQRVYETLRENRDSDELTLIPLVRLGEAQMNLHLGVGAQQTAWHAWERYPDAPQAVGLLARALSRHGDAESAHHVLARPRIRSERGLDLLETRILHQTERFREADNLSRASLLPRLPVIPGTVQKAFMPPAELSALWHRVSIPSEEEFAATAERLRHNLESTTSPFLRGLISLWLECYDAGCEGQTADADRWRAIGRDDIEKATALSQLALLHCREDDYAEARNVVGTAVKLTPTHAPLWHMLISLSGVDRDVVSAARRCCPEDGDIWLAELVYRTQHEPDTLELRHWVNNTIAAAVEEGVFSVGVVTRAAEYLFRGPHKDAAVVAARNAAQRARGLLPAYVIAAKCALYAHDRPLAIEMTDAAIEASLAPPPPFYEKMVELKTSDGELETDMGMVEALQTLHRRHPREMRWAEMLGYVRFHRGGWELVDALYQMTAVLASGATNRTPVVIGAEAARLLGNYGRAAEILRRGLELHPGDVTMLNNLAYTLAQSPAGYLDALRMVPRLETVGGDNPGVLDTIAYVQYRNQDLARAAKTAGRVLQIGEPRSRCRFRARRMLAQIALEDHRPEEADMILRALLRSIPKGIPDEDIVEASITSRQVMEALEEKRHLRQQIERGRVVPGGVGTGGMGTDE